MPAPAMTPTEATPANVWPTGADSIVRLKLTSACHSPAVKAERASTARTDSLNAFAREELLDPIAKSLRLRRVLVNVQSTRNALTDNAANRMPQVSLEIPPHARIHHKHKSFLFLAQFRNSSF